MTRIKAGIIEGRRTSRIWLLIFSRRFITCSTEEIGGLIRSWLPSMVPFIEAIDVLLLSWDWLARPRRIKSGIVVGIYKCVKWVILYVVESIVGSHSLRIIPRIILSLLSRIHERRITALRKKDAPSPALCFKRYLMR